MLNSFSWLNLWGVEGSNGLRSWPPDQRCWCLNKLREWSLDADLRAGWVGGRGVHQPSASHWWSGGIVNFLSHFSGLKEGKLFCNLAGVFFFPPGWKCRGCRWLQTLQETPGCVAPSQRGNLFHLSRLLGHKLFFGCSNFETLLKE